MLAYLQLSSQLLLLPSNTLWMRLILCLNSKPTHILPPPPLPHHGSSLLCPCRLCNQDIQIRVYPEPANKISYDISHPSLAKSREKLKKDTWGAAGISPVRLDLKDLNVKQMEPRHSSKTHCPVWLFWHFIWIYLFILLKIHLCSQVGNQSTQTESFSRDVLPPSERGWEREEFSQLTDVWKKSYQEAQSLVCLCMLGLQTKFSGCVQSEITNSWPYITLCSSSINSNHYYLISPNSSWARTSEFFTTHYSIQQLTIGNNEYRIKINLWFLVQTYQ